MQTPVIAASIAAIAAVISATFAARTQVRVVRLNAQLARDRAQEERMTDSERIVSRYREPLGHAAYDLQSRLYNILNQSLIEKYVNQGDERTRYYVESNTVFLIAQYFAWTEIVRKEIQFIDLGENDKTRQLARLRDNVYSLWQTDSFHPLFRVFAGEQRAIGEKMIVEGPRGPECIGYATFLNSSSHHGDYLIKALRSDTLQLTTLLPVARPRLVKLQHALIDLLSFLDPDGIRFSLDRRTKVDQRQRLDESIARRLP
jgi:hypothetical protein